MQTLNKRAVLWLLLGSLLWLSACAFQPQTAQRNLCTDCDYQRLSARGFELETYWRQTGNFAHHPLIHIYLEGDGQPWSRGRWPAANPSSRRLTALQLMTLDPNPSIYLNRPCYGLNHMPDQCTPDLWTSGRYSREVVKTMQAALDQLKEKYPQKRWLLIGHSGGGSLAMLIAQGRDDVAGIITLAANLDTDAWTRHFGYLPLDRSLNPATMPPLPRHIPRSHFAADGDAQVPESLVADAAERDEHARFILLPGDHHCCWKEYWPGILHEMAAQLIDQFTGTK